MKQDELIEELKKRGFLHDNDIGDWVSHYRLNNILVVICPAYIDVESEYLIPYTLKLNGKRVIGNKRLLKYIDKILEVKE